MAEPGKPHMMIWAMYNSVWLGNIPNDGLDFGLTTMEIAIFCICSFFMIVVMLNLLIAIMGDQYDIVQESGHEQYLYAKAGIILDYEARMSRAQKENPKLFPEWLQLLQAKTGDIETSDGELSMTGFVRDRAAPTLSPPKLSVCLTHMPATRFIW